MGVILHTKRQCVCQKCILVLPVRLSTINSITKLVNNIIPHKQNVIPQFRRWTAARTSVLCGSPSSTRLYLTKNTGVIRLNDENRPNYTNLNIAFMTTAYFRPLAFLSSSKDYTLKRHGYIIKLKYPALGQCKCNVRLGQQCVKSS